MGEKKKLPLMELIKIVGDGYTWKDVMNGFSVAPPDKEEEDGGKDETK